MSCPDEETFARVQARSLGPVELADFHRHLDNCPACLELAAVLGCIKDNENIVNGEVLGGAKVAEPALEWRDRAVTLGTAAFHLRLALIAMTLAQAYFSFSIAPLLWRPASGAAAHRFFVGIFGHVAPIATFFISLWCLVGLIWAVTACWALLAGRRWAPLLTRIYAIMSLPTIALIPLGILVIVAARRPRNYS